MDIMKNITKKEVLTLKDQISYHAGQVVSKTLIQNSIANIFSICYTSKYNNLY